MENNNSKEDYSTNNTSNHGCNLNEDHMNKNELKLNINYDPKYIYKNNAELLLLLEKDFQEYAEEVNLLYNNSKEMLEFDPKDYDLIQAVEDNLVIIHKRLELLQYIKMNIKKVKPSHPLVDVDILSLLNIDLKNGLKIDSVNKNEDNTNNNNLSNNTKNIDKINDIITKTNSNSNSNKNNNIEAKDKNNNENNNEEEEMMSCVDMLKEVDL